MTKKEFKDKRLEHIYGLIDINLKNTEKILDLISKLDNDFVKDKYKEAEGVVGVFDGVNITTKDGQKIEVPSNYSAKSRLVIGDTLKMIDDNGTIVFKQIDKVPRKKIEGILTKKEGKWYILADAGTYKVSDMAADYYRAQINDSATAFIPVNDSHVTFAALDVVKPIKKEIVEIRKPVAPVTAISTPAPQVVAKEEPVKKVPLPAPPRPPAPKAYKPKPEFKPTHNQSRLSSTSSRNFAKKPSPPRDNNEDYTTTIASKNVSIDEDDLR